MVTFDDYPLDYKSFNRLPSVDYYVDPTKVYERVEEIEWENKTLIFVKNDKNR